jgi:Fe-S-cluster containining protein
VDPSDVCRLQCRAACCQGPLVLRLSAEEAARLTARGAALGVPVVIVPVADGARLRFTDHPDDRCPMLDPVGHGCRIYPERPARCRAFPEAPTPGCLLLPA